MGSEMCIRDRYGNEGKPFLVENKDSDVGKVILEMASRVIESLEGSNRNTNKG